MIRAIAIDDEPPALIVLENLAERSGKVQIVKSFVNTLDASKYLRKYPVDLIFLDIHMPSQSGIDFYKKLEQNFMVIFTTAFSEYAVEGFNLNAVDYLLKPILYDRFLVSIDKVEQIQRLNLSNKSDKNPLLVVRADYELLKIPINNILFIESFNDHIKINLSNNKIATIRMTMKNVVEMLPKDKFLRVHRSFTVAHDKIEVVRKKIIHIGDFRIPIGKLYWKGFSEVFDFRLKPKRKNT